MSVPQQAGDQLEERYFYQATDGQWIFLSQLDLRILAAEHGGLANCPGQISTVITGMDTAVQTEGTRRRFKRLSHVPLTGMAALTQLAGGVSACPHAKLCQPGWCLVSATYFFAFKY